MALTFEEVEPLKVEIEGPFVDPTTGQEFEPEGICSLELWPSKTLLQGPTWLSLKGVRINDGRNSVWIEAIPSGREPGAAQRIFGTFTVPSSKLGKFATVDRKLYQTFLPQGLNPAVQDFGRL